MHILTQIWQITLNPLFLNQIWATSICGSESDCDHSVDSHVYPNLIIATVMSLWVSSPHNYAHMKELRAAQDENE